MVEIQSTCITCGTLIRPGRGRCWEHGGKAWASQPPTRRRAYRDAAYLRNRKIVLQREPICHWRLKGCTGKSTTADHVIPVARGGSNALDNLVGACARCNAFRGASLGGVTTKARRKEKA